MIGGWGRAETSAPIAQRNQGEGSEAQVIRYLGGCVNQDTCC